MNEQIETAVAKVKKRDGTFAKFDIKRIINAVEKLKIIFEKEKTKSQEQEIDFFKNIKPKFTSKLIYYNAIYKLPKLVKYNKKQYNDLLFYF